MSAVSSLLTASAFINHSTVPAVLVTNRTYCYGNCWVKKRTCVLSNFHDTAWWYFVQSETYIRQVDNFCTICINLLAVNSEYKCTSIYRIRWLDGSVLRLFFSSATILIGLILWHSELTSYCGPSSNCAIQATLKNLTMMMIQSLQWSIWYHQYW